jgi:glycosyltransferase involved in cell wall biosynthesis
VERARTWEHRLTVGLLRRLAPALLQLPDKEVGWLRDAVRRAQQLIQQENVEAVYTRACPFSSHLIGYRLKQLTGLPWVAHFSDPWVNSPYFQPRRQRHRRFHETWEQKIVTSADALTFATGYIRDGFVTKYPVAEKSFVVSNSFDRAEMKAVIRTADEVCEQFTLTHVGQFYGIRSPVPFLRALRQAMDVEPRLSSDILVRFVGNLSPEFERVIYELGLENHVAVTGTVPYFESLRYQATSDALLMVDAPCDGPSVFLPSKLLEYLAFGKPILALTPRRGISAGLVAQAGGTLVEPDNVPAIAQGILEMWRQFESGQLQGHNFFPHSCESSHIAGVLANVLCRVSVTSHQLPVTSDQLAVSSGSLSTINPQPSNLHAPSRENLEEPLPLHLP